jgi:predicted Zn finger-like uncharacterized protein
MILQCEACGARFRVPDSALGQERHVRCGRCKHAWTYIPGAPGAGVEEHPDAVTEAAAQAFAEMAIAEQSEEKSQKKPGERPPRAPSAKRYAASRAKPVRSMGPPRWVTALSTALFLLACALAVPNFAPRMMGASTTEGLLFQNLVLRETPQEGKGVRYIVTGAIVNKSEKPMAAPELRFRLTDGAGKVVREWRRTLPAGAMLDSGTRVSFTIDDLDAAAVSDPHMRVELGNWLEIILRRG